VIRPPDLQHLKSAPKSIDIKDYAINGTVRIAADGKITGHALACQTSCAD
jgi:hypothetical protein